MRHTRGYPTGPRLLLAVAAFAVALALVGPAQATTGPGAVGSVPGPCSKATAHQLVEQYSLNSFLLPDPVVQVLCGEFAGPGSVAMAITIGAPTCWPTQRWAVFRVNGDAWQLVLDRIEFVQPPLVAAGSDLRVSTPVYRFGDPRCNPRGGTRARTWRWDGARFTAVAEEVTPGKPLTYIVFTSPRALRVTCTMWDGPRARYREAYCESNRSRPYLGQKARVRANGRVISCRSRAPRTNKCRFVCGCFETPPPILRYGMQVVVGRFRCRSARSGIRCVVIRSGKGFAINKNRVWRIGPR